MLSGVSELTLTEATVQTEAIAAQQWTMPARRDAVTAGLGFTGSNVGFAHHWFRILQSVRCGRYVWWMSAQRLTPFTLTAYGCMRMGLSLRMA